MNDPLEAALREQPEYEDAMMTCAPEQDALALARQAAQERHRAVSQPLVWEGAD